MNITTSITIMMPKPLYEVVIEVLCGYYQISRQQLFNPRRTKINADRRHILYYLISQRTGFDADEIATLLNVKTSIVSYGIRKVQQERGVYRNRYNQDILMMDNTITDMLKPFQEWLSK